MSKFAQYEAFAAIIETGSISLAADSLNRTPSALSKQITNLEADLGTQLFDRSNKKMVATDHGLQFYKTSSSILRQIREAENQLILDENEISGVLTITLSRSLIGSRLMGHLNEFSLMYPNTRYELRFSERIESFQDSKIDFAFRIGTINDSTQLIAMALTKIAPIFYATPEYLSQHGKPKSVEELNRHRVILPPLENLSHDVRRWLKKYRFSFAENTLHRIDDVNAIQDMVLRDGGIGFNLQCSFNRTIARQIAC